MSDETCPYAPRHKADHRGVCTHCNVVIAEPWYMRRRPEPEQMVAEIANEYGHNLGRTAAREIVKALFGWADRAVEVYQLASRQAWESAGYRDYARAELRTQLIEEVAAQGAIMVTQPSEAIAYLDSPWVSISRNEVPRVLAESGKAPWTTVEITLAVQCRVLPVDRAAAVWAGIA